MLPLEGDWKQRIQVIFLWFGGGGGGGGWLVFGKSTTEVACPAPGRPRHSVLSLVMLTLITWLKWCLFFEPNSQKPFQRFSQWAVAIRQLLSSALG